MENRKEEYDWGIVAGMEIGTVCPVGWAKGTDTILVAGNDTQNFMYAEVELKLLQDMYAECERESQFELPELWDDNEML